MHFSHAGNLLATNAQAWANMPMSTAPTRTARHLQLSLQVCGRRRCLHLQPQLSGLVLRFLQRAQRRLGNVSVRTCKPIVSACKQLLLTGAAP